MQINDLLTIMYLQKGQKKQKGPDSAAVQRVAMKICFRFKVRLNKGGLTVHGCGWLFSWISGGNKQT